MCTNRIKKILVGKLFAKLNSFVFFFVLVRLYLSVLVGVAFMIVLLRSYFNPQTFKRSICACVCIFRCDISFRLVSSFIHRINYFLYLYNSFDKHVNKDIHDHDRTDRCPKNFLNFVRVWSMFEFFGISFPRFLIFSL